jgi:hypothetical protein
VPEYIYAVSKGLLNVIMAPLVAIVDAEHLDAGDVELFGSIARLLMQVPAAPVVRLYLRTSEVASLLRFLERVQGPCQADARRLLAVLAKRQGQR